MSSYVGKTAEYNPKFTSNSEGKTYCPKCNSELSERDKANFNWYCCNCEHIIIIKPPYHEISILGYNYVLLKDNANKLLEYPGGFLKVYCPRCKKPMFIDKIYPNPTGKNVEEDKSSISLGYVCNDRKNCGYAQVLRILIPSKEIKSFNLK